MKDKRGASSILNFMDVKLNKMPRKRSVLEENTLAQLKKYGKSSHDE